MKPLVSAAAAAILLVGGRRGGTPSPHPPRPGRGGGGDDEDDETESAVQPLDARTVADGEDDLADALDVRATPDDAGVVDDDGDGDRSAANRTVFTVLQNSAPADQAPANPPAADWDWTDPPDDSSIWRATAAILGDTLSRPPFADRDDDDGAARQNQWRDGMETLSAALRGLRVSTDRDSDVDAASTDMDSEGDDSNDVRPLIAVTIGLTLFLLSRSPKAARRAELEAGVPPAGAPVFDAHDEDVLLAAPPRDYSAVSDLRAGPRDIVIVTTAALPWMTGTAVNPLLRAVYLAKAGHVVSLVVPWLESPEDQRKVYPAGTLFASRDEQAAVIVRWARDQVPDVQIRVRFYEGVYSNEFGSILPLGDITAMFVDDVVRDVCVLEEPEHLTWYHSGRRWTSLFRFCVGVVHTNYLEYARKHGVFGPQRALFLNFLNKWVCRSYCHRVIKLSDAVQTLPHSVTCNVHGVRARFIDIGSSRGGQKFANGAYFLGKVLWAKGYQQLVELMEAHHARTDERLPIDFFGAGPDLSAVKARVSGNYALSRVQIHGVVVDHASDYLQRYKVYVNPSKSDVVCTATAEALAMGKFVVCLRHPSNEFFATFDNCLIYDTPHQFSTQLAYALAHEPKPLSEQDVFRLSWEAATERFYDASYVPDTSGGGRVDSALALTHKTICKTLVTPPANSAVRQRYRTERKPMQIGARRGGRGEKEVTVL